MRTDKLKEECGVFGISIKVPELLCVPSAPTDADAAGLVYNGLLSLQHRGQESAGIAVAGGNKIVCHKDRGLVGEVFAHALADMPKGNVAVGHTRYSTTGGNKKENAGPFVIEFLTGRLVTAHNGNVTNAKDIRDHLVKCGLTFCATSDSEVVSAFIAYCITQEKDTVSGIIKAANQLRGAFSLVIALGNGLLVAVRDPSGYRPLCVGDSALGCAVASESCALEICGFSNVRDMAPGEVVVIENGKIVSSKIALKNKEAGGGLCIFEYVYFARPDSFIDNLSVYEARFNMGCTLAEEYPAEADVVCGVPDSGLDAAVGYSVKSGLPVVSGFVKNRYIGRSFIYPTQSQRDTAVRLKLNPLSASIKGKRVILVDDSIVRGTTSEKIVRSLKNAGASEVHLRISSPPFKHTCHFGTDIDSEENLIANRLELDDIRRKVGADSLGFISIEGLKKSCSKCNLDFCTQCFTGNLETLCKKDVFEK